MKISFVIPAYNEEDRISECLFSLENALARESGEVRTEVIAVNNASTDQTKSVASKFSFVRVVDEPHKGLVWARRAGYLASSGDLIANIDADTLVPSGWLAKVIQEFAGDPELLALSGPYVYYDAAWHIRATNRLFYFLGFLGDRLGKIFTGRSMMLQGGNFILRREALEKIGGFDTSIAFYGEDTDIGRRIGKIGKVKWTFGLPMYSSGRRFQAEGLFMTGVRYVANFIWILFFGKPFGGKYRDIRSGDLPPKRR
jgi:glycosyltransferase involved in cell wall biosynthesis